MSKLYNLARVTTATTGTGTLTLGGAVPGFLTFAQAGAQDGDVIAYAIRDGVNSEIGYGTYTASGTTLTRNIRKSTNADTAIPLSGNAEVVITPSAEDGLAPLTTRGDILRRGASVNERLALGTSGYHLQSDGTDAAWAGFLQAGTGAQTRTWQAKARDIVHAADFGAVGDGTTNDTAAIQAAIDAMAAAGGGMVLLGPLTYSVTDLTISTSAVGLIGTASGRMFSAVSNQSGTQLKARAGTTTLLTVGSPSTASQTIAGCRIENITLNGNDIATRSLHIKPITNSTFRNLVILGASTSQLETTAYTSGGSFTGLDCVYQCAFENIWVNAGSGSAKGIVLSGEPAGAGGNRTVFCMLRQIHITHTNGTALEINDADSNSFVNIAVSRNGGGAGVGIDLVGDDADAQDLVHSNLFFFAHAGPGGWSAHGSRCQNNFVFGLGTEDAVPVSITNSAELWYFKDDGSSWLPSLSLASGAAIDFNSSDVTITHSANMLAFAGASSGYTFSDGNAVFNHTASLAVGAGNAEGRVQIHGTDGNTAAAVISRFSNGATGGGLHLSKSRGASIGTNTIVQNGDTLGIIQFAGADGTGYILGASISAVCNGTPGTNDMPGALIFSTTADGAASATEALRIRSDQQLQVASASTVANGTVATVLGSLGPTGSNTTVQEWLRVRNAAGTIRYIPCF